MQKDSDNFVNCARVPQNGTSCDGFGLLFRKIAKANARNDFFRGTHQFE